MMNRKMGWKSVFPLGMSLLSLSALSWSEVVFDGSTRQAGDGAATGPAFVISEADGFVSGSTLVHSFSEFSIASNESATFTGSNNITLLLNRVTGSSASSINGAITSDLANADFYFLNPNGVIFGSEAAINVPGAFTVSTASRLDVDGVSAFDVNGELADSTLTIANPEQLTFIFDDAPSNITLTPGADLSHGGGDMTLVASGVNSVDASLSVFGGTLSIGSSDSQLSFDPGSASSPTGEIRLENTNVAVGGQSGGAIRIMGGELIMDGGGLDLDPIADSRFLASGDIELTNGYEIDSEVTRTGVDTDFVFEATNISINADSEVETDVDREMDGGLGADLQFTASESFELIESNLFTRIGFDSTNSISGDVVITAPDVVIDGVAGDDATSGVIQARITGQDSSRLGAIEINAENLFHIKDGASLRHETGTGGTVDINAGEFRLTNSTNGLVFLYGDQDPSQIEINADTLFASDSNLNNRVTNSSSGGTFNLTLGDLILTDESSINTSTFGTADGVPINLNAENIRLTGGSFIASNTLGSGSGGEININASQRVLIAGQGETFESSIRATTADLSKINDGALLNVLLVRPGFGEGEGGIIRVSADEIVMEDGALISSFAAETDASVIGREVQTGNAGDIFLEANRLNLSGNSVIETRSEESAGGNVDIRVVDFIGVLESNIQTDSQGASPNNPGGDIFIDPELLLFRNATVNANANGGNGGNIQIIANNIIRDPATRITASSNRGIDGDITIDGVINDVSATETEDVAFSDVTKLLSQKCTAAQLADRSSFVVSGNKQQAMAPTSYELAKAGSEMAGNPAHERFGLNLIASCFY
jgi:filamentous hemagglutinin family protein